MLNLIFNFIATFIVLSAMVLLVPNVVLEDTFNFILSFLVVGFINFLIRPMLLIIRGSIAQMELAGSSFLLNLLILNVASGLIDDFDLTAFCAALFGAVMMSLNQILIERFEASRGKLIS